ncbi:hypothetical protein ACFX1X_004465 [Malus domestica]
MKAFMLLDSLPDSWSVTALTLNAEKDKLGYNDVWSAIIGEEWRRRLSSETSGKTCASNLDSSSRALGRSSNHDPNGHNKFFFGKHTKVGIEDLLCVNDLDLPLLGERPEDMKDVEWRILDRQALKTTCATLSTSIALRTANEKTTKGLMAARTDVYELKSTVCNKVQLLQQLMNLKMKEGASAMEHMSNWSALVTACTLSAGKDKLRYNNVMSVILAKDRRRRYSSETSGNTSAKP